MCVRACVRACVSACVRACVRASVCVCDAETDYSSGYGFIRIQFQINYVFLERFANFILRHGATDCKVLG